MIISFAWTTRALLAGRKTVTRRDWSPSHAAKFHVGDLVDAYDRSPRVHGRKVATIRITAAPRLEATNLATQSGATWDREGFAWLDHHGSDEDRERCQAIWHEWRDDPRMLYVVEFELVEIATVRLPAARRKEAPCHSTRRPILSTKKRRP